MQEENQLFTQIAAQLASFRCSCIIDLSESHLGHNRPTPILEFADIAHFGQSFACMEVCLSIPEIRSSFIGGSLLHCFFDRLPTRIIDLLDERPHIIRE